MRTWIRRRPWFWILALIACFVLANAVMLAIALRDAPTLLPH